MMQHPQAGLTPCISVLCLRCLRVPADLRRKKPTLTMAQQGDQTWYAIWICLCNSQVLVTAQEFGKA